MNLGTKAALLVSGLALVVSPAVALASGAPSNPGAPDNQGTQTAAANKPSDTGQPSQSYEEQPSGPAGFDTAGFAHAQTVYANVDGTHMVSQYDVACYQVSQH